MDVLPVGSVLRWQLGDEAFMQRFKFLNSLKVRGSYGTTGNTAINPYQTQGTLSVEALHVRHDARPRLQAGRAFRTRISAGRRPIRRTSASTTRSSTIASRAASTAISYSTHDLLLTRLLPVTSGFTSTLQNIGSTKNTGTEISLSTLNLRNWRGVTWTSDFNVVEEQEQDHGARQRRDVGRRQRLVRRPADQHPATATPVFYDYKYVGVWQYADSLAMKAFNANGSTFKFGDPRVADINGDGKINANDRTIVGTSYPAWTGSMSNRITWKGLDVSALVTAKWDYTFVDGTPRSYFGRFGNIADLDYWTPTNPTNKNPAPTTGAVDRLYAARVCTPTARTGASATSRRATRWTRASCSASVCSSVRVYATAQEPYIHSSYIGIDPEVGGAVPTRQDDPPRLEHRLVDQPLSSGMRLFR